MTRGMRRVGHGEFIYPALSNGQSRDGEASESVRWLRTRGGGRFREAFPPGRGSRQDGLGGSVFGTGIARVAYDYPALRRFCPLAVG